MANYKRWWQLFFIGFSLLRLRFMRRESDHQLARQAIAEQLSNLGGIAMKVGQVIADVGTADELRDLLDGKNARPLSEMLPLLEQELGQPIETIFTDIQESTSAASLGQVHQATLMDNTTVAVKIQYPYIAEAVQSELKMAGLIPGLGPVKKWGMDLNAYKQTLANNMQRELDYRSEASRQKLLTERLDVDGLVIPKIYSEYCAKRVLVQSWEQGELLDQILDWPKTERMLIGRTLLMTLFQSIFKLGEVHGDPHMGNTFYRHADNNKPEVVLLDYGCTIPVQIEARLALLQLIINTRDNNPQHALRNFAAMGFDPHKLSHIGREIPLLAQILFKPFLSDEPFDASSWKIKANFDKLLAENKWWFRSAGPSELFLLMRAFQGVVRQLDRLQVKLPWWPLLQKAAGEDVIMQARSFAAAELPDDLLIEYSRLDSIASVLRIHVTKQDEVLVDMTLPAHAALELEEIMPDKVRERITTAMDFDFEALTNTLLETQFTPQEIITISHNNKNYRIWLE